MPAYDRIGGVPYFGPDGPLFWWYQVGPQRDCDCLGACMGLQLCKDGGNVMVHCLCGNEEAVADFRVAQSIRHQPEHFHLAVSESGRVLPGARSWTARKAVDT